MAAAPRGAGGHTPLVLRRLVPREAAPLIDRSDFGFYDNSGKFVVEPGSIDLYAGNSSKATLRETFTVSG